jgi:MSHA biogenesis protein MshP|tara:strand:+ start:586 stop:1086 length:501 start_codon:yes stop_codon:yes gene_type:complete
MYLNKMSLPPPPNPMTTCQRWPKDHANFSRVKQKGSMLMIALFVIIVFALLGLTLTKLLSSSTDAIIHEVYGQRALNAANAGIEQALSSVFPLSPGTSSCIAAPALPVAFNGNIKGLENCSYVAGCQTINVTDNATYTYYRFESTGSCQAGDIRVSRRINIDGLQK